MWKVIVATLGSGDRSSGIRPLEIELNNLESNHWEIRSILMQQLQPEDSGYPLVHVVARKMRKEDS